MRGLLIPSLLALGLAATPSVSGADEGGVTETVQTFGPVSVGAQMPTFAGYDADDRFVRSKSLLEQTETGLIISFFATWCGPCRKGMPVIEQSVATSPGWKAVFIDLGEDPAVVRPFLAGLGIESTVIYDQNGMIAKRYGVTNSLPKTFVTTPDGTVRTIFVTEGADFAEKLAHALSPPTR